MKRVLGLAVVAAMLAPAVRAADVGLSVEIGQPGVYGRIDIGRYPEPAVILPQPVLVAVPPAVVVQPQPIYMWVSREDRKHWKKACHRYNACAVPVYFVRHDWYDEHVRYAGDPYYHGKGKHKAKHKDKHKH
jgi:hypothetical protein